MGRLTRISASHAARHHLVETDLDRLSNSVVSLIDEGRLEEADAACEQLIPNIGD